MGDHIELHKNLFRAVLDIPKDVQHILGRTKFLKPLRTGDRRFAKSLAVPHVAAWKAQIRQARATLGDPRGEPDALLEEALRWREALAKADPHSGQGKDSEKATVEHALDEWVDQLKSRVGDKRAKYLTSVASGAKTPLVPLIPKWIQHLSLTVTPKTADQYRADLQKLLNTVSNVEDMNRRNAYEWIQTMLADGKDRKTVKRAISGATNFWRWAQDVGVVGIDAANPFDGHRITQPVRVGTTKPDRRLPFTPEQIKQLHEAALKKRTPDQPLADLIALAAHTGARIEELCSLRVEDVGDGALHIRAGKTKAAVREVPIHPAIKELVARLAKDSTDTYLIPADAGNKYSKRSPVLSKRFGHLKTALGLGSEYTFHCLRNTVATLLENAGVPEGVSADILGHAKKTMTYGLYSKGASLEVKAKALAKIKPMVGVRLG